MIRRLLWGLALGAACAVVAVGALTRGPAVAQVEEGEASARRPASDPEQELAVRITPEMERYSYTRYALYFAGAALDILALLALLRFRVSARIRDYAKRKSSNPLVQAFIYYPVVMAAYGALVFPLAVYSSYLLPHQYGLSNQSLSGWALDRAKQAAIGAAVGPLIVALLYWSLRRSPRRWWLGFWLASIPLTIAAVLLVPLVIEPLFNRFGPLRNEALRARILALAQQAGIERSRVFEVDASKRTKAVNAYVTGIGGSARIVLWDTLLERLNEDEVLHVMAHEIGHYAERHVPIGLALAIFGTLGVLLFSDASARRLIDRYGATWGVHGLDDLASLPLLMLIVSVINFVGSPVESAVSRTMESRADQFALRLTGNPTAGIRSFVKLSELNLSHPSPPAFVEFWMFSHPPLQKRIDAAKAREARP